jgi:hypothetical protein
VAEPQATPFPQWDCGDGDTRWSSWQVSSRGLQLFVALVGDYRRPCNIALALSRKGHTAAIIVIFVIAVTATNNHHSNNEFREG